MNRKAFVCVPVLAALCLLAAGAALPQAVPRFEVASVKPAGEFVPGHTRNSGGPGTDNPTRIHYPQVFMMELLTRAYGLDADRVSGPDWLRTERYSVEALVPPGASIEAFRLMLQSLLQERFHLAAHREQSQRPGYVLVVAKGGHKMKPAPAEVPAPADVPRPAVTPAPPPGRAGAARDGDGFLTLPRGTSFAKSFGGGMVRMTARLSMGEFVRVLGAAIVESGGFGASQPVVVDQTGLAGRFDFKLEYAGELPLPPEIAARMAVLRGPQTGGGASSDSSATSEGPTLFRALQQLGLRLEKTQPVAVETLVVDRIDKVPTQD
jgi:uncharacterized protein (TIGR03435 family)